jgi:hypothetical protein
VEELNRARNNIVRLSLALMALTTLYLSSVAQAEAEHAVDGPFRFVGRTPIDTAFEGVTSGNNIYDPMANWESNMPDGFQGMRSSSYPWSTTTYRDELWMGTISSGWCVWPMQNLELPFYLTTYESRFTGCSVQNVLGTPSQIYIYNFETGTQELVHEGTLATGGKEYTASKQRHEGMAFASVMGLRAAGSFGDLVFFAGHHKHSNNDGWLRIYVFNARKRAFLGHRDLRGDTTRRFKAITDENGNEGFYTIIGAETGMMQNGEGPTVMLRWVGTEQEPFKGGNYLQTGDGQGAGWDVVSGANLDKHYGMIGDFQQFAHTDGTERLIMSSAAHPLLYDPDTGKRNPELHESVMLLSQAVPAGGWTRDQLMDFEVVFGMDRYDPDESGRWGAKWGTTDIHEGYIYFGTYHQGTNAGYLHFKKADRALYDKLTSSKEKHLEFAINQWRASSVFRMKLDDIDAVAAQTKEPELLYGYSSFEVADETGTWVTTKNNLEVEPRYGEAGMGHPGNVYSWTSVSKDGQLFWGFFDAFSGTHDLLFEADASWFLLYPGFALPVPFSEYLRDTSITRGLYDWAKSEMSKKGLAEDFVPGGDLIVFEADGEARVLTKNGFGNPCANGVRNAEVLNDRIFFATSTWCNLSDRAGLEFYEYAPELDTPDTRKRNTP